MSAPPTTKVNMIFRLADPEDQQAWDEFIEIYTPLLIETARRLGLTSHDASDAVQEVLVHLVSVISRWKPSGQNASFRRWLARVSRNQMIKALQRTNALQSEGVFDQRQLYLLGQVMDPQQATSTFNLAFRKQVFLFVIDKIQGDFKAKTWQAFWLTYVDQVPPADVAEKLSFSVGAVYIARSRVMSRLRGAVERLMDNEWESLSDSINQEDRIPFDERLHEIRTATTLDWQVPTNPEATDSHSDEGSGEINDKTR